MTIRPEKLVVTSNYSPEQCFSNPEDIGPILRRFRVITDLRDLPPIPDQVPPELLLARDGQPEAPGPEQVLLASEEGMQGQLLHPHEETQHNRKRSLEQEVTREEVSREPEGGDEHQEDYISGQHDNRCYQQ